MLLQCGSNEFQKVQKGSLYTHNSIERHSSIWTPRPFTVQHIIGKGFGEFDAIKIPTTLLNHPSSKAKVTLLETGLSYLITGENT